MFFESSKVHQGIWKLIDFDCASKVGQPVPGISLDFAAPETVLGARSGQPVPASFAVDMFALGQVIHWLASSQSIWGPRPTDASMTHMLCQEEELPISESSYESEPAFALAQGLLLKDPYQRMSLKTLIVCISW
jgi:serine/threonine protein kinase